MGFTRSYISQLEADAKEPGPRFVRELERLENETKRQSIFSGARALLRSARESAGLSVADLAKKIGREIGYIQALEAGNARLTESTADLLCNALPGLDKDELMAGSDLPPVIGSKDGTYGLKPDIELEKGLEAKYVPLISWTQAGTMASFDDEAYQYEGHIAFNVTDRKAIALKVRGDSMTPEIREGDVVILYPSFEPRNGEVVVARLADEQGGDVMCKVYNATKGGRHVKLTSYNPAHPPLDFEREDFVWIYPVASVVKQFRR